MVERRSWKRAAALIAATAWGLAIAAVQLGPSWQFAELVGHMTRSPSELLYYQFPAFNWFDLVLPQLIRDLERGPEDPYWFAHQTEAYEVALYIGTLPLICAILALSSRPGSRPTLPWKIVIPISFAMATMVGWWPEGYLGLTGLPGFGLFRVPARYTLLCSLGLAILAGEGLDRPNSPGRLRRGLISALIFAALATAAAMTWSTRPDVHLRPLFASVPGGFLWAAVAWLVSLLALLAWAKGRLGPWAPLIVSAVELGILFYHGTTQWGWAVTLPGQSRVLTELSHRSPQGLIGGEIGNLPVRLGLKTAHPYLGFATAPLNRLLLRIQDQPLRGTTEDADRARRLTEAQIRRWLKRLRVSHLVGSRPAILSFGKSLGHWQDRALDQLAARDPDDPATRDWSIVELPEPFPEARVAPRAHTAAAMGDLLSRLSREDDLDTAWFLQRTIFPHGPRLVRPA